MGKEALSLECSPGRTVKWNDGSDMVGLQLSGKKTEWLHVSEANRISHALHLVAVSIAMNKATVSKP